MQRACRISPRDAFLRCLSFSDCSVHNYPHSWSHMWVTLLARSLLGQDVSSIQIRPLAQRPTMQAKTQGITRISLPTSIKGYNKVFFTLETKSNTCISVNSMGHSNRILNHTIIWPYLGQGRLSILETVFWGWLNHSMLNNLNSKAQPLPKEMVSLLYMHRHQLCITPMLDHVDDRLYKDSPVTWLSSVKHQLY